MLVFKTIDETRKFVSQARELDQTIGFVPTMGALHPGHLELMRRAKKENDLLVVSIFVNPIQFNNATDLKKYPRVLFKDLEMLKTIDCDAVFVPSVKEMYPEPINKTFDFGPLENVMEGAFRPGHFNGVAIVVEKLFEIVEPHKAYFGEKDFQQLAIIKSLVEMERIPVEIVPCAIVREKDGLAMSSRNVRLSPEERAMAPRIFKVLKEVAGKAGEMDPVLLQQWGMKQLQAEEAFDVEYFQIAEDATLQTIVNWQIGQGALAFVALKLGQVRLIDNIRINS
ncbi:MAG: pantoate--beta-alanine ligase [Bacteroidetes bacterium HGW-Bacteroidetes-16]|jgi:pantoate--beta-alanine ligase|nr:MAG: pantoate--beta-alanine ligase [Bacteroidetes bacterium HGW-Bacteroidetes-16]